MRRLLLLATLTTLACAPAQTVTVDGVADAHTRTALRALSRTPLFDGHNDLPWAIRTYEPAPMDVAAYDLRQRTPGHTDIERLRAGRLGAQFWSVYIPMDAVEWGAARTQLEQIDIAKRIFERYPDVFQETLSPHEVMPAFRRGRIASVMGMEGGHALENSLGALRAYFDVGVRYMTLTHWNHTDWADAATAPRRHGGLTEFGREVVREMNRLGMLVDLSHTSDETMHAALDVSEAPVIFSHSSVRAVTNHVRNVPDDVLRRLPANGGVVMITFVPAFVSQAVADWSALSEAQRRTTPAPQATIDDVIAHIEHARRVAGIDHVGIGADYDGITSTPVGLEDVSTYPRLFAELARRGWSELDLRKLAGDNVLRAWRQADDVARRLQRQRPPSTRTIEELDGRT